MKKGMKKLMKSHHTKPITHHPEGISLISLIITIIVIIILAAIVIFSGLNTPDSASFAGFTQQVDNVYQTVMNKYVELKSKHAIRNEYRTDEQIYIEIATTKDSEQYASMNTITVNMGSAESGIEKGSGIQNIVSAYSAMKDVTTYPGAIGMTLPKVRESNMGWYVTKEGKVFNANGYIYDGKTYFSGSLYQVGELPAEDTRQEPNAERIYVAIQGNTNVVTEATGTGGTVGVTEVGGGETPGTEPEPEVPAVEKEWTLTDNDSDEEVSYGDLITPLVDAVKDEKFYVVDVDGDDVILLAAQRVDPTRKTQESSTGTVQFDATSNRDPYSNEYEGSIIQGYVNDYAKTLTDNDMTIKSQRLLLLIDLQKYDSNITSTGNVNGLKSFFNIGANYWLGSLRSSSVRYVGDDGNLRYVNVTGTFGLRPVIIVSKSKI